MSYNINVPNESWSVQSVTLGGNIYKIELKYKHRTQRWYLSLFDSDNNPLMSEKKCVSEMFISEPYEINGFTGALLVEKVFGDDSLIYPSRNTFGLNKEFQLKYYDADEFKSFAHIVEGDYLDWKGEGV